MRLNSLLVNMVKDAVVELIGPDHLLYCKHILKTTYYDMIASMKYQQLLVKSLPVFAKKLQLGQG